MSASSSLQSSSESGPLVCALESDTNTVDLVPYSSDSVRSASVVASSVKLVPKILRRRMVIGLRVCVAETGVPAFRDGEYKELGGNAVACAGTDIQCNSFS